MAMRGIDHDGIDPGTGQQLHTFFGAHAHAHRSANAQFTLGVTRRIGKAGLLGDVLDGDQPLEFESVIDHQQAFDLVLVQQDFGLGDGGAVGYGDQLVTRRHDVTHGQIQTGLEAQIAPGHQADYLATVAHRKTRHAQLCG